MITPATQPRAQTLEVAGLAFSMALTVLVGVAGVVLVPRVLVRGSAGVRISLIVLVFMLTAGASIVLLTRLREGSGRNEMATPLRAGLAAAGALVLVFGIANAVRASNAVGWADALIVGLAAAVIIAAWPVGGWLAERDRLVRLAGRLVTAGWTFRPVHDDRRTTLDATIAVVGAAILTVGLVIVLPTGPFGHDESIYALKARSWIEDTPTTGWAIYRPIGMSVIGWIVLQFSSMEPAFRVAAVVLSLMTIGIMWFAGRGMYDRVSATVGAAVFIGTESFLRRATEFLNDVGSAGLMLGAMFAIWYHFERRPDGWWLLAAAPLGAAAYYLRYGSALGLVIIAIVAAVIWWRRLAGSLRQIAATAGLLVLLLIPHFAYAIAVTGNPFGVFQTASTSVGGGGGGLADYLRWLPASLAGPVGTALLAIAVIYLVWAVASARSDPGTFASEARTVAFLVLTSVILTIALGAFTHGEPRFVYLPLMLMILTGARGTIIVWSALRKNARAVTVALASALLVVGFAGGVRHMADALGGVTDSRSVIVGAADAVRVDAGSDTRCAIRSTYIPQLTWYAVCSTFGFTRPVSDIRPGYLVLFENGKRQPTGSDLAGEIEAAEQPPIAQIDDPDGKIGEGVVLRYP